MKTLRTFTENASARTAFILTLFVTGLLLLLSMWQNLTIAAASEDGDLIAGEAIAGQSPFYQLSGTMTPRAYFPLLKREPTPTPTLTPTPSEFFNDDFSNPNSGWIIGTADDCKYEYVNGVYRITITDVDGGFKKCLAFNTKLGSKPNGTFTLRVRRTTPSDRAVLYGFYFGAGSDANKEHWALEVRPQRVDCDGKQQGFYWLSYVDDGDNNLVGSECSNELNTDTDGWNTLKIIRDSDNIRVYINDERQGTYDNNKLKSRGFFDLVVTSQYGDTSSSRPVIVEFDYFKIE